MWKLEVGKRRDKKSCPRSERSILRKKSISHAGVRLNGDMVNYLSGVGVHAGVKPCTEPACSWVGPWAVLCKVPFHLLKGKRQLFVLAYLLLGKIHFCCSHKLDQREGFGLLLVLKLKASHLPFPSGFLITFISS